MSSSISHFLTSGSPSKFQSLPFQDIELAESSDWRDRDSAAPLVDAYGRGQEETDASPSSPQKTKGARGSLIRYTARRCQRAVFRKVKWLSSHVLMLLGCYQVMVLLWSLLDGLCPDNAASVRAAFGLPYEFPRDTSSVAEAVVPIPCHSHNDYWRVRPFFTAIEMGCTSVEADVWLEDGDLLVGHSRSSTLRNRSLRNLYLKPMLQTLDARNSALRGDVRAVGEKVSMFQTDAEQSLVLLIDFKMDGHDMWPVLLAQLEPLRRKNYLTHFDGASVTPGPVTVVVSGDVRFEDVVRNRTYRDVFYDAPLDVMETTAPASLPLDYDSGVAGDGPPRNAAVYSPVNSYYASVSFKRSIGHPWHSSLSHAQIERIRGQIKGAHARGLKVRYWGVPSWPLGVRNYLWRVLVREGADVLSVDDVEAVTRQDWGPKKGGWNRKWWP